jgi:hypothetical protein
MRYAPTLAQVGVRASWHGIRPMTPDRLPCFPGSGWHSPQPPRQESGDERDACAVIQACDDSAGDQLGDDRPGQFDERLGLDFYRPIRVTASAVHQAHVRN